MTSRQLRFERHDRIVGFYEDRAKIGAASEIDPEESLHDLATDAKYLTSAEFLTLDDAIAWCSNAVAANLTFYGVAEIRELRQIPRAERCACCVCQGVMLIRHHHVGPGGVEETIEDESPCVND